MNESPIHGDGDGARTDSDAARRQWQHFLATHARRRRVIPRAIVVGALAGLLAVAFRLSVAEADGFRDAIFHAAHAHPLWGISIPLVFSALGGGAAVLLVRSVAPETSGSGIPHVEAVLQYRRGMRWSRVLPVKFIAGFFAMNAGLALGREGPTVQMGAAVAQMVGGMLGATEREKLTLIAAGAGAGLAAAFNAPLAGLIFVVEELKQGVATGVFTAAFMAAVTADLVTRALTGQLPVYFVASTEIPALSSLPAFAVLGGVAGLLGILFNRGLLATLNFFSRMRTWPAGATGLMVGLGIGLVGWFLPQALGDGHRVVDDALRNSSSPGWLIGMFALRFSMTMASYGCGAPGGIFTPLLVLGATFGRAFGDVANGLETNLGATPQAFAVVGMAAYFTATVRAPLTGIVLILEMTGNYDLMLPLLTAGLAAYAVAEALRDRPVYEALLQRELLRDPESPERQDALFLDLHLQAGAPYDGMRVRELGLPPGCLLLQVRRSSRVLVPNAETRLLAGDHVTAVIGPSATEAVGMLRHGMGGP